MAVARSRLGKPGGAPSAVPAGPATSAARPYQTYREFKEASERNYFKGLLEITSNMSEGARIAGLSRGHLYELLKKHGFDK